MLKEQIGKPNRAEAYCVSFNGRSSVFLPGKSLDEILAAGRMMNTLMEKARSI